jgi:hypothetical protein
MSQSRISPFQEPEMSSRMPPRCIWMFVIYCLWLRQDLTVATLGLRRLVEEADGVVAEAGSEDVTGDPVGG